MLKLVRELEFDRSYGLFVGQLIDSPVVAAVTFDRQTPSAMSDPAITVLIDVDASMVEDLITFAALWGYESWHEFLRNEDEYLSESY